jgi:hypothetical protein
MQNVEESASWEDIAKRAQRRTLRRIERFDFLVALLLLMLLIFGWVMDFASRRWWPGGDLLTASRWPYALSGGALR